MSQDIPHYTMPQFLEGYVWLVGAGPGDPGLITLLGAHALREADIVVYDALVSPGILEMANPDAELKYAGKRGGKPSSSQRDITLTLIQLAREGKRVLRLKGGDPFVFGRGGEEALRLAEAGVPFRIVPGISAGLAAPAYAGIPLTHRDHNSVITFLTGHGMSGDIPDSIDWVSVSRGSPVIVMYMAMKHLPRIVDRLIEAGRNPEEPVAIISRATTLEQEVLETRLGECVAAARATDISPPAIVIAGSVVSLRSRLDWMERLQETLLPLPGRDRKNGD
jgi:uroporphyrin-III C-methyltransferase